MNDASGSSFVDSAGEYRILENKTENDPEPHTKHTHDSERPHTQAQHLKNRYQHQHQQHGAAALHLRQDGATRDPQAAQLVSSNSDFPNKQSSNRAEGSGLQVGSLEASEGEVGRSTFANFINLGSSSTARGAYYEGEGGFLRAENEVPLMGSESSVSGVWEAVGKVVDMCREMLESVVGSCFGKHFVINGRRFQMMRVLGEGGFSFVYLVKSRSSGDLYAIKRIYAQNTEQRLNVRWEIQVHDTFSHKNLLRLVDSAMIDSGNGRLEALLLFPAYTRGSLVDILQRTTFAPKQILSVFVGICKGVLEMHKHNPPWAHRDIKPANVLLSNDDTPVLMDFGSTCVARVEVKSRSIGLELQEQAAKNSSMPYRACELWDPKTGSVIDERTDVWSLGCLLFAMVYGRGYSPFECQFGSKSDIPTVLCRI